MPSRLTWPRTGATWACRTATTRSAWARIRTRRRTASCRRSTPSDYGAAATPSRAAARASPAGRTPTSLWPTRSTRTQKTVGRPPLPLLLAVAARLLHVGLIWMWTCMFCFILALWSRMHGHVWDNENKRYTFHITPPGIKQWLCGFLDSCFAFVAFKGNPRNRKTFSIFFLFFFFLLNVLARSFSGSRLNETLIFRFFLELILRYLRLNHREKKTLSLSRTFVTWLPLPFIIHTSFFSTPVFLQCVCVCVRSRVLGEIGLGGFMVKLVPGNEKPYVLNSSFCGLVYYPGGRGGGGEGVRGWRGWRGWEPRWARVLVQKVTRAQGICNWATSSAGKCQKIMASWTGDTVIHIVD